MAQLIGGSAADRWPSASSTPVSSFGATEEESCWVACHSWSSGLDSSTASSTVVTPAALRSTSTGADSAMERFTRNSATSPDSSSCVATASTNGTSPYWSVW